MAYRVNGILYRLRFLSLSYESGFAKTLGLVLPILRELLGLLLGKLLYMAAFFCRPLLLFPSETTAGLYACCCCFGRYRRHDNSKPWTRSRTSYYAVFLLRMDARRYALSAYGYTLLKDFMGFLTAALVVGRLALQAPLALCLLTPVLVCSVKLTAAGLELAQFTRRRRLARDKAKWFPVLQAGSALLAAHSPSMLLGCHQRGACRPAFSRLLRHVGFLCSGRHFLLPSGLYRRIFTPDNLALLTGDTDPAAKETQAQYRSKLTLDSEPESRKTGCARFNELFMRRNRRLLMRPARRTAVIAAVVLAAGCAACLISPAAAAAVNGLVVQALPGMLLLMYFINRGNTVTRALFFNCDRSMLCYRFYRQPRVILGIFTARLKSLTAINLLPTTVIALGLPLLLLCSGGTDTPLDYAVLALSILAMSVFFSVHYLVLYYLLQPYTAGLENTSYAYRIITGLTYVVCYLISANVRGSTAFGVGVVLFAAVYVAAALLLAYHLAPRTFKLRT